MAPLRSIRSITANEKPLPQAGNPGPGPNQDQLGHVSEEAAATDRIIGDKGPDLDQGTPVQEVLDREESGKGKAPQIVRDKMKSVGAKGLREFSTSSKRSAELATAKGLSISMQPEDISHWMQPSFDGEGHKFGLPDLPIPARAHLKHRYDPVVQQVTNLLMQHGKLSVAQKNMALILNQLRTAPTPTIDPRRPLLLGSPPATHLPLNPTLYLTLAVDSVAPLLRIRSQRGAAGGGVALQLPVPLRVRQRRRQAIMWILDAASKRRFQGSGRGGFAQKVAEEIRAVIEGRSGVWDRRGGVHRLGIAARSNLSAGKGRRR